MAGHVKAQGRVDISTDETCKDIINRHRKYLEAATELKKTKDEAKEQKNADGIMHEKNIQENVHLFVSYGIWMQRRTHKLEKKVFTSLDRIIDTEKKTKQQSKLDNEIKALEKLEAIKENRDPRTSQKELTVMPKKQKIENWIHGEK